MGGMGTEEDWRKPGEARKMKIKYDKSRISSGKPVDETKQNIKVVSIGDGER